LLFDFIFDKDWTLLLNKIRFDERLLKYIFGLVDYAILFFLQIIISVCALVVNRDTVVNAVDAAGNVHVSGALFGCAVVHFVGRLGGSQRYYVDVLGIVEFHSPFMGRLFVLQLLGSDGLQLLLLNELGA
jgi:hypothetical protein